VHAGGYCGKVFVTDITKFKADKLSENGMYDAANAVSSLSWNPGFAKVASASTDAGDLHMFDVRVGQYDRSNRVIRTGVKQLYSHVWTDNYSALLGFGDGFLRLFDIRMPHECVVWFQDQKVHRIGSISLDPQRRFFVTFGNPNFSVWRCDAKRNFTFWYHDPSSVSKLQLDLDPWYKNDGAFMTTGGRQHGIFATTDAHGFICLYDAHSAEQAAVSLTAAR
jgi:WD40 repeat protein